MENVQIDVLLNALRAVANVDIRFDHRSAENAEVFAQYLMMAARMIGGVNEGIKDMCRLQAQQIFDEPDAVETICLKGEEVRRALCTLAMRFDRAALIKSMPDE